jgi:hypothetical protein
MYNKDLSEYPWFVKSWAKVFSETPTEDMYLTAVIRKLTYFVQYLMSCSLMGMHVRFGRTLLCSKNDVAPTPVNLYPTKRRQIL